MRPGYKRYAVIFIALIVLGIGLFYLIRFVSDKNKLTTFEKKWISENKNNVSNVSVLDDLDVFGKNGSGVFYDIIDAISEEHELKINPVTYKSGEEATSPVIFKKVTDYNKDYNIIYRDHFVVIGKGSHYIPDESYLKDKNVGIIASYTDLVTKYFETIENVNFRVFDSMDTLKQALDANNEINYAIIPLNESLETIIGKDYNVLYHISDLNTYYIITGDDNSDLYHIMVKFFNKWKDENLDKSIKKNQYDLFVQELHLSSVEIDKINSKNYTYGFINQSPYEVIASGNYGGIVSYYISEFSKFADLDFSFKRYKNFNQFSKALSNKEVDIYFNYYDLETPYATIPTLNYIEYDVISSLKNDLVLSSLNGLKNYDVYALNNSKIAAYLRSRGINVKTYKDNRELFRLNRKNVLIVLDSKIYDYYQKDKLDNYTSRYKGTIKDAYSFKITDNDVLNRMFTNYLKTIDPNVAYQEGIMNHTELIRQGNVYKQIIKYISLAVLVYVLGWLASYRLRKKVRVSKRIKKEDKIRYIDQLTLLKNRNYFTENVSSWNKNTIYPQSILIIDLNHVHEINDTLGYEKGDKQIQAAANILIKTQLDNSEIIRTDGNEFMVYTIGYSEKQIASYIRKLNKEFKYLPYEYGATIGKSFITSELKSVDDALNEAIDDMKNQKEETKE